MKWIADQVWVMVNRGGISNWYRREAGPFYLLGRLTRRPMADIDNFEVEGVPLAFPPKDRRLGISDELRLWGTREPIAGGLYLQRLRRGDVVFEVGLNIGHYAAQAAPRIAPSGSFHGFEPDPEVAEIAEINLHRIERVHGVKWKLSKKAVAEENGTATFYQATASNHGSLLEWVHDYHIGTVEVETISLDSYCRQTGIWPTVVRMDIEGGEFAAFRGMKEVLKRHPFLFVEVHEKAVPSEDLEDWYLSLARAGYETATLVWQPDYPWTPVRWRSKLIKDVRIVDGLPDKLGFRLLAGRD